ncbi:hypothetical protein YC2023_087207 [Brassica napus]
MVFVAFVALIILYVVIPVVLVQGLAQLETWFPFLKSILNIKVVITGYLPISLQMYCLDLLFIVLTCSLNLRTFAAAVPAQRSSDKEFEVPPTPFSQLFSSLDLSLLNVYAAKYETGGKFWPQLHYLLFGSDAIGIFGLKELPLASSLTIPLPILTVLFSIYCQRRFSANFKSYPTECLVNKDEADAIEQNMSEFYPAVSASRCSGHLT